MRIEALNRRSVCLLKTEAFDLTLRIEGLDPAEMAALLGAPGPRPDWQKISTRGPIRIGFDEEFDDPGALPSWPGDPATRIPLEDGWVELRSDQPGIAGIDPEAGRANRLLPSGLHLLLAQQWARQGLFPLHAAALSWKGQGLLLLGDQGAGKSTLVLAAMQLGATVVSDDWLLVGQDRAQGWRAERLRQFLMFRPGAAFDRLASGLGERWLQNEDGRRVLPLPSDDPAWPAQLGLDRAVWLDAPAQERPLISHFDRIDQARLLAALVGAAMPRLLGADFPHERTRLLQGFQALVARLPARRVCTGQDLLEHPDRLFDRLIEDEDRT
ncbi:hypothetical protein [Wenzhouxiangella marina]|uniref:Uncharacterized protein n=1 Tax=Wenzhouxiangella marina TaxID=1579979 RepID=A0A0K0XXV3_9GAMM|nr:hypothetical protein [Wenzhouxiangella marina]AKS42513.1 hypothetical protein WM2015_2149 [Wenzhouxiangella marina]MBB6085711.1 energy-coupling factor transporter ATP-binding protein EcfA2 [Wenzhouxiangella marina]